MTLLNKILGRPVHSTSQTSSAPAATSPQQHSAPSAPAANLPAPSARNPFKSNFVDRPAKAHTTLLTGESAAPPKGAGQPPVRAESKGAPIAGLVLPNLPIRDHETTTSKLTLASGGTIEDLQLQLDIRHTRQRDLVVSLTSPAGTSVTLINRMGDHTDDIIGRFDASAFAGESAEGEWTLTVEDKALRGKGELRGWGLTGTTQVGESTPAPELPGTGEIGEPAPPVPLKGPPVIAVLDGGVQASHMDLKDAMWRNEGEIEGDGIDNDENGYVDDVHGINVATVNGDVDKGDGTDHGTHVAGIIAAADNGKGNTGVAAGKVQLLAIGGIYEGSSAINNFEAAVDYVIDQKTRLGVNIRILNASFGDEVRDPKELERWDAASKRLLDADILVVAATANGYGSDMDEVPGDRPSNAPHANVLVVASLDRKLEKLANFSSFGAKSVDLAAPGQDILSTVPKGRWAPMSGTSMATPHVSATAALMLEANPGLTAVELADLIKKTVALDDDLKGKVLTGGKLDIEAAVKAARDLLPRDAAVDASDSARVVDWK